MSGSDFSQILPGLAGPQRRHGKKRSSRFGVYVFALLLPLLAGVSYYGLRQLGWLPSFEREETTSPEGDMTPPSEDTIASLAASAPVPPRPIESTPASAPDPSPQPARTPPAATVERTPSAATEPGVEATPTPSPDNSPITATPVRVLKGVDQSMKAGDLDAARKTLESFVREQRNPTYLALAYYRLGSLSRLQKKETEAMGHWRHAHRSYPDAVGGRVSAVAIADTLYARHAGTRVNVDEWPAIRAMYCDALGTDGAAFLPAATRAQIVKKLHRLNDRLIFSDMPIEGALFYTVRPGDFLARIAKEHGVHHDSIMAINGIRDARRIRAGQKLKILKTDNVEVVVDKSDLTTTWYLDGRFVRQYPCCIGPQNKTPAGQYKVIGKEVEPVWHDPKTGRRVRAGEPDYPLGTRWIALSEEIETGLGFHGTDEPDTIPGRVSNGCIRLHQKDVEELFGFIPLGAKVTIQD